MSKPKQNKTNLPKAFTLIELLVVIAIIGLLASAVSVSFSQARKKARDARRRQDLNTILKALDLYYDQYGTYGVTGAGFRGGGSGWFSCQNGGDYIKSVAQKLVDNGFLGAVVKDPKEAACGPKAYMIYPDYRKTWQDDSVCILASLEDPTSEDKSICDSSARCVWGRNNYNMNYIACIK